MARALWVAALILNSASLVGLASGNRLGQHLDTEMLCALGSGDACATIAYQKLRGFTLAQDLDGAQRMLREGCDEGNGKACRFMAELHAGWRTGPAVDDNDRALEALQARLLDKQRSAELYQRGCDLGDADSCRDLGGMLVAGDAAQRDRQRGIVLLRRGCELGDVFSCHQLGDALREDGDEAGGLAAHRRGSSSRLPWGFWLWACSLLGSLVVAVVAVVMRPDQAAFRGRRIWVAVAAVLALVLLGLAAFLIAGGDADSDRAIGWGLLLPAALVATGAFFAWRGSLRIARPLLLVGGFLSLPLGLFGVLAGREARAALRAATAES
jgi:hypothetical protein